MNDWVKSHGPNAVGYTISQSKSTTPGAYQPYTQDAIDWIDKNQKLLHGADTATAAAFLVPQSGQTGNVQMIHDELINDHLREKDTPQQFLNAMYIQQGNNMVFGQMMAQHQQALAQATASGDSNAVTAERQSWAQKVQDLGVSNPLWLADYQDSQKSQMAVQALAQMHTLFSRGLPPEAQSEQSNDAAIIASVSHARL